MTTVSVVIPTLNRATTLRRAVASVQAQSYPVHELIVVDDGSTDDTRAYAAAQAHIHYVHQLNRGVSAARNRGIELATGEYIAFLDSDDAWLPSKLAEQVSLFRTFPESILCHTEEIWIRNGRRVNQHKKHRKGGGDQFARSVDLCCISPSSVLLHRSAFERYGLFDERLPACEDYDLWLRICSAEPVLFVSTPQIYKYGGHSDQLSHHFTAMDRFRVYALDKLMNSGTLSGEQERLVVASIRKRLKVLCAGAKKHGNTDLLEEIKPYVARWSLHV